MKINNPFRLLSIGLGCFLLITSSSHAGFPEEIAEKGEESGWTVEDQARQAEERETLAERDNLEGNLSSTIPRVDLRLSQVAAEAE